MKSNYRKLGEYIRQVDVRNTEGKDEHLLGVSVQKMFMPSIANTIGTDFSKYKVVKRGQFTYIPDTSRRGDKIAIALLKDYDEGLVSNIYTVFEISDSQKLMPEYLMLWFSRPEFDRYARFKSHGSVREIFDWNELCKVELPVPSFETQTEIVREYNTIADRIALKQRINDNLAQIAVTIFKSIFENKYMDENTLPHQWYVGKIGDFCSANIANMSQEDNFESINYLDTGNITQNYIDIVKNLSISADALPSRAKRRVFDGDIVFSTVRPNLRHYGIVYKPSLNFIASTGFAVLHNKSLGVSNELLYMWLTDETTLGYLQSVAENSVSTYPSLNVDDLLKLNILVPDNETLERINRVLQKIFIYISENNNQIKSLIEIKANLLSQLSSR